MKVCSEPDGDGKIGMKIYGININVISGESRAYTERLKLSTDYGTSGLSLAVRGFQIQCQFWHSEKGIKRYIC